MKMKMLVTAAVALALLATMGIFAVADTVTHSGTSPVSGTVTARATVNPMIALTITTPDVGQAVEFGAVNPETAHSDTVNLEVRSNRNFDLTRSITGDVALMGFSTSLGAQMNQVRGVRPFSDTYSINVPYTTLPGSYAASVTYTVTQQ